MRNNLLLYKSEWGATKQYAEWIRDEEPSLHLCDIDDFDCSELDQFYKIVIGSRTYLGKIEAIDFMVENWERLSNKKVYLFSVGVLPPNSPESIGSYAVIPEEIRSHLSGYAKLPGRVVDEQKKSLLSRILSKDQDLVDELDKVHIEPIVSFLKGVEWKIDHGYRNNAT